MVFEFEGKREPMSDLRSAGKDKTTKKAVCKSIRDVFVAVERGKMSASEGAERLESMRKSRHSALERYASLLTRK